MSRYYVRKGVHHRTAAEMIGLIEELEAMMEAMNGLYASAVSEIEELEAKLAMALDFIEDLTECEWPYDEGAKRILADLTGGKDE